MFCISMVSVVIFPFSSRILVIWLFSLLFFVSVAKDLSILFTFSKNQFFLSIFWIVSFVSISLISALILIISCLLLLLLLFCSSFYRALSYNVRSFSCWLFILFWNVLHAMNFPLSTVFIVSQRFWYVVSSFLLTSKNFYLLPDVFCYPYFIH